MKQYATQYELELRENVIPFWEKHAPDREFGGFFSCLDRDGSVYDTEKFMWMQWRIVWMFAELSSTFEANPHWVELARGGFDFLTRHGIDDQGRYCFSLTREGTPATAAYNVYSDCFATMGAAALFRATQEPRYRDEALRAFGVFQGRQVNPKGQWEKSLSGRRPMQKMGYFMMQLNLALVLEQCLGTLDHREVMARNVNYILDMFWNEKLGLLFEYATLDGQFELESMLGRHINPGHAAEAAWLLLYVADLLKQRAAIERACEMLLRMLEFGWDKQFGGIFYFKDALGKPHFEIQWDAKLWWVHVEALVATALAYKLTRRTEFASWFQRIHEWTWSRFPDRDYGEWFGYLNRRGEPTHMLKGGKWKSFFHLPRCLLLCQKWLAEL